MPGLQRARRRLRPRVAAHHRDARRRRVRDRRPQDLDELLRRRRLVLPPRAHRSRRPEAQGPLGVRGRRCTSPGIEQRPLRMINGVTNEFGQVLFDGARVPAENMIGEPGEGWRVAMTIVSHEREPGELGYVARYAKTVKELERKVRADPAAFRADQREAVAWAHVQAEMLRLHVCRRLSERLDGIEHGPGGSIDKLLMTWVEQTVGAAALAVSGPQRSARRRRRRAQDLPLQPGPERHGRHVPDPEEHRRHAHPRPADRLTRARRNTDELRPARRHPRRGRRPGADRAPRPARAAQRDQRRAAPRR